MSVPVTLPGGDRVTVGGGVLTLPGGGGVRKPGWVLGALPDWIPNATVAGKSSGPDVAPANLSSVIPGTAWVSPTTSVPDATLDVDLGAEMTIGTVFLGGLNLGPSGSVGLRMGSSAIPGRVLVSPDGITEGTDIPTSPLSAITGDPENPDASSLTTTARDGSLTVTFPNPGITLRQGGLFHSVRVAIQGVNASATVEALKLRQGATELQLLPHHDPIYYDSGIVALYQGDFDVADLPDPSGDGLEVVIDVRALSSSGTVKVMEVDLALTEEAGPPIEVVNPWHRANSLLGTEHPATRWRHPINVAWHSRTSGGLYRNTTSRHLRLEVFDQPNADEVLRAAWLFAGPSLFLPARPDRAISIESSSRPISLASGGEIPTPATARRVWRLPARVDGETADAVLEALGGGNVPAVIQYQPGGQRAMQRPILAMLSRPQLQQVNQSVDWWDLTLTIQEVTP